MPDWCKPAYHTRGDLLLRPLFLVLIQRLTTSQRSHLLSHRHEADPISRSFAIVSALRCRTVADLFYGHVRKGTNRLHRKRPRSKQFEIKI